MHRFGLIRPTRELLRLQRLTNPYWSRCLSYVPIDDRFFGLSEEEIELRGMALIYGLT